MSETTLQNPIWRTTALLSDPGFSRNYIFIGSQMAGKMYQNSLVYWALLGSFTSPLISLISGSISQHQFGWKIWKMPTQKTISSFFNTMGTKRTADDAGVTNGLPQNKSSKTDETSPSANSSSNRPASSLSPEQRARMEANREAAKKKLLASKSPQFFGASWKKALGAEFTKEYFVKVRIHCTLYVQFVDYKFNFNLTST